MLQDTAGNPMRVTLKGALYVPSFPHDIFSVKAATKQGAEIKLKDGHNTLTKNGTSFTIEEHNRLYYLNTIMNPMDMENDKVNLALDIQEWHKVLGHCNFDDITKLESVVKGMKVEGTIVGKPVCTTCIEGKCVNTRNKKPDARATRPLQLIHTDLSGPVNVTAKDNFRFAISFTDDFSGFVSVYLLRNKSDTTKATEQFLADTAPYGNVKCIRSDNGGEYISNEFRSLLRKRGIRHELSSPYSPHQNGTAERNWRTLFEMARCLLLESGLPKTLWTYAIKSAAYIRNRCYNNRTNQTPYETMTGVKPDLSKMSVFGSECYAYKHDHTKLDTRCEKGNFVGHDTNSPAYLIFYPGSGKVLKHRLVKFISKNVDQNTQTSFDFIVLDSTANAQPCEENQNKSRDQSSKTGDHKLTPNTQKDNHDKSNDILDPNQDNQYNTCNGTEQNITDDDDVLCDHRAKQNEGSDDQLIRKQNPARERNRPKYLDEYVIVFDDDDSVYSSFVSEDFCYKLCGDPQNYREALESAHSSEWKQAMAEEIQSLKENDTFDLVTLPDGRNSVGGKWVFTTKENAEGTKSFKARYVAKGYQIKGIDYQETFSPTANITSVRALMQIAAQNNLIVHQMDVKTAYLHAPIDTEIYIEQPEGFQVTSDTGEQLVCKLKKSLYGLKQSGRNWNRVLHEHLCNDGFVQNPVDHCVYKKNNECGVILVIVWVDDLIIATSDMTLMNSFKESMKEQFKMKDLGCIKYFLGIEFTQEEGEVKMSQKRYLNKILERFGMADCKPRSTPCEAMFDDDSVYNNELYANPTHYRELVGSLIYAATSTRPDISWVVSKLSQHLSNPSNKHMVMAKQVLRYLRGTLNNKLIYRKTDKPLELFAFCDSDWASCLEDRKSTTGYCFSLNQNGGVISWKSKKQPTVALSTCEAEYMGLGSTAQESLYLLQLIGALDDQNTYKCVTVFEDNQGAIALSKNPVNRQRSKHIDIRYHFVHDILQEGKIDIKYCPTEHMVADVLTKATNKFRIQKFKKFLFGN